MLNNKRYVFFNQVSRILGLLALGIFLVVSCVQDYVIPTDEEGHLIIEGYITDEVGDSEVRLSLSGPVANIQRNFDYVSNAQVLVVEESGVEYSFSETTEEGVYKSVDPSFVAAPEIGYSLRVILNSGQEFSSEIIRMETGPQLNNLTYEILNDGSEEILRFLTNANPGEGFSGYYRYTVDETWENVASSANGYIFRINFLRTNIGEPYLVESVDTLVNNVQNQICWPSLKVDELQTASTTGLSSGSSTEFSIHEFPLASSKLLYKYSAKVNQYAIDEQAFQFLNLIRSFSEEDGLLFNKQPGQLIGNVEQVSGDFQEVLGLFQVSMKSSRRLSFSIEDLPPAAQSIVRSSEPSCSPFTLTAPVTDSCDLVLLNTPNNRLNRTERQAKQSLIDRNIISYIQVDSLVARNGHLVNFFSFADKTPCNDPDVFDLISTAKANCVDCGSRNGLNVKPEWWDAEFQ